ncbi:MAG: DUF4167 domain-containing protein [Alphaproteobacteria bacterium]|nr:DUF4167 domain-containing protein [Alphaproteobacteria bacterium]
MRGRHHHQGRSHHHKHQPLNRNHVFDSNGPDVRLRGTSQQLFEKYLQLGRDATSAGDRVQAESYFQHAEHYYRILMAMQQAQAQQQPHQGGYVQQRRPMPANGGYEISPDEFGSDAQGGDGQPQFEEAQMRPSPIAAEPALPPEPAIVADLPSVSVQAPAPAPQVPAQQGGQRHHGPRHRHPRGPRGPRGEHGGEGGERPESEAKPGPTGD